jgi:hypothetical protein
MGAVLVADDAFGVFVDFVEVAGGFDEFGPGVGAHEGEAGGEALFEAGLEGVVGGAAVVVDGGDGWRTGEGAEELAAAGVGGTESGAGEIGEEGVGDLAVEGVDGGLVADGEVLRKRAGMAFIWRLMRRSAESAPT